MVSGGGKLETPFCREVNLSGESDVRYEKIKAEKQEEESACEITVLDSRKGCNPHAKPENSACSSSDSHYQQMLTEGTVRVPVSSKASTLAQDGGMACAHTSDPATTRNTIETAVKAPGCANHMVFKPVKSDILFLL